MATGGSKQQTPIVDVVGIGSVSWDRFVIVPRLPGANERVKAIRTEEIVGGTTTTALVALRRWKLRCRLISSIGYDEHSVRIVDDLTQEGIETDGLLRREDVEGASNIVLVDNRNGQRLIVDGPHGAGGIHRLRPDHLRAWWFEEARLMHVDTSMPIADSGAIDLAKKAGLKIVASLHHSIDHRQREMLRGVDWILADSWTASELTKETDPSQAAYSLHLQMQSPVVVHSPEEGAYFVQGRETLHQPGTHGPIVDRSGSGAVFQAGFMYGILSAWDVARSLRMASWAAGMACREIGGRKGIPTEAQIRQFLVEE
jgi:sugar/nucleoside kinase (ribokinase family)